MNPSATTFNARDNGLEPWWHPQTLTLDQTWHFAVGPLSLFIRAEAREWLLAWTQQDWKQQEELDLDAPNVIREPVEGFPEDLVASRYVFSQTPTSLRLTPQLLERPMVVKTRQPVRIPPGQEVTFYISSPVKIAVHLQDPDICLEVLPTLTLSDTWFGPNTREGDLCYAARTHARNNREELPLRPHRAVTPVHIKNRSALWLTVDKLSIPLPFLAVYGDELGSLWTNSVALEHTDEGPLAALSVGDPPAAMELLTPAQEPMQSSGLVRAFTSFFSD